MLPFVPSLHGVCGSHHPAVSGMCKSLMGKSYAGPLIVKIFLALALIEI
jgi:hypothetical protein